MDRDWGAPDALAFSVSRTSRLGDRFDAAMQRSAAEHLRPA